MKEIIAVIVGAVVIGLIAYLYKRRQGNRIIIRRISETPQINISQRVRKNLKITYNDQPVDNLVLNNLVIYNNGNEIIEPLKIEFKVYPSDGSLAYLAVEANDPLDRTTVNISEPFFVVDRPHIDIRKKYPKEEIRLAVFSNISLIFFVKGGGRGWDTKFEDSLQKPGFRIFRSERLLHFLIEPAIMLIVLLIVLLVYLLKDLVSDLVR